MKIAIQAADLDSRRIDGTRVYILNLLKYFGKLDPSSDFLIYHRSKFNPELIPPDFPNYKIIKKSCPCLWTQIRFAYEIIKDKPDILWMPMQALPMIRPSKLKTVITVHDLAFKIFPKYFPKNDLRRLNMYADYAIRNADKIIAVSNSTKKDIIRFFPKVNADKIGVIYHGFDNEIYHRERDAKMEKKIRGKYGITKKYIFYTGALQPRKNLVRLIKAYEIVKQDGMDIQLVLAGGKAWMFEAIFEKINMSPFKSDIINTGRLEFSSLGHLLKGASAFVFPSLYEGFGIPVLEAFAAGVPVILARNSSLVEVGGDAALFFETGNTLDLAAKIRKVMTDSFLVDNLIIHGRQQEAKFSWEKCAKETLEFIKR